MTIDHVLAVVAVSDFDASHDWYRRLFDAPATNVPMPGNVAEWRVTDTGWLQVFHDPDRAGMTMANFAVADLAKWHANLRARGVDIGDITEANKSVRLCSVNDPDNNVISFIGGFREQY